MTLDDRLTKEERIAELKDTLNGVKDNG